MEFNQEDFIPGSDTNKEEESSSWFKRVRKGILTSTSEKKDTPEGLWIKCPQCKHTATNNERKPQQ
jgi:acetyl-CoA carboxylase carboxyl transferase subunit beta